ncbi:MAG: TIR domain-containing protein [Dongiaceae bacterium]
MQRSKDYNNTRFSVEVLKEAINLFLSLYPKPNSSQKTYAQLSVHIDDSTWEHDNEDEFFEDYRKSKSWFTIDIIFNDARFRITGDAFFTTRVLVKGTKTQDIQRIFSIFESHHNNSIVQPPPTPKKPPIVFIGHGHDKQWRDLKDHLQEQHHYCIEAYETGTRAGHTIRDILDEMASKSSIAFLVLTAEDEQPNGKSRARQNVIHEIGLFQGKLGFSRAIVLLEADVEKFSNLEGIQQIRFSKGNIRETYGDVLATIKRELGDSI